MREPDRIIRLKTVLARTGLSRSTLYRKIAEGTFPRRVRISANGAGWHESDINRWVASPVGGDRKAKLVLANLELAKQELPRRRKSRYLVTAQKSVRNAELIGDTQRNESQRNVHRCVGNNNTFDPICFPCRQQEWRTDIFVEMRYVPRG